MLNIMYFFLYNLSLTSPFEFAGVQVSRRIQVSPQWLQASSILRPWLEWANWWKEQAAFFTDKNTGIGRGQGTVESNQGRVVRKPGNVNPGLNVNWSIIFSCLKMFFTSDVWCSLRLLQHKTEG